MDTGQNNMGGNTSSGTGNPNAASKNIVMAILAYIGPLVIVSWATSKNDPFVKFHIKQGLVLLVIEVVLWILGAMLWEFWMIWQLINLCTLILSIIGIVNAAQGKEHALPLVGGWSSYFNF